MMFKNILIFTLAIAGVTCSSQSPVRENKKSDTKKLTDDQLLDKVQRQTFRYFWDFAEPHSGMARERYHPDGNYPDRDANIVTTGGSGFGLMSIISATNRGYIKRKEAVERLNKIADFLTKADRFHGAWSHWIDGETGKVKPFGTKDNGGDLVETSFLAQGFLVVREYFKNGTAKEKVLAEKYDKLWKGIEWNWYTKGGEDVLYWHWSPNYAWDMNFKLEGYNECLITYVMAASSPTHTISREAYDKGWARNGKIISDKVAYGFPLILKHNGAENYGGPLFWAHYSYLGLDPNGLKDQYADYQKLNYDHSMINYSYAVENPKAYKAYGKYFWGLTASYSRDENGSTGYNAHMPGNDVGVVSPTAAISSIVYTPKESIAFIRNLYENYPDSWGLAGFYDALSPHYNWTAKWYLAIDQGPEVVMLENYRSGLIWKLFMNAPEIQQGLKKLGFTTSKYP
ncbi:glucoamylase family protein [Elizabethkingia anophelis]|uniref:glucoamylase family protein n=1 Tax=Elizabethkingia anophelis TaxID=1117645 RepID=UPI00293C267F|nr:beta-glucosidase [Elizabethkingia anophelis]MDV3550340.1 beta-glucosidase [Elizabethkingia anophelis]MDV3564647.1 beta-glucosidase [Elizabethkingia anophelis]MDV3624166.1 beta-glucosidase [Elizabethkingia anophelis]MDV3643625.1 beta-glucosidase [Elizabethkingia anophelis]